MQNPTQEDMALFDKLYMQVVNGGIPLVSEPVSSLAEDYLRKSRNIDDAVKSFVKYQMAKCTTSGFLTGLGGIITLPITIPANIGSVLYVQLRMIAGIAYMGGFDVNSDQVKTMIFACAAGVSVSEIIKNAGLQIGTKLTTSMVKKIPGTILTKINQKVGFRLLTKFGSKGTINFVKVIPVVGGVVGGGFDFAETKIIAHRAYKLFIQGDVSSYEANIHC